MGVKQGISFYTTISKVSITQDQIDDSTNLTTSEMAGITIDSIDHHIVEIEQPKLIGSSVYTGLRLYTSKQMHKIVKDA